jgi:thiamine biosynthesis protein ThiS
MNAIWVPARRTRSHAMLVTVNGDKRDIPAGLTLTGLLQHLQLAPDRVAIERNREIVLRGAWRDSLVEEGDMLEILHLVGGG